MFKNLEKKILAYALANAISHKGKARADAVIPKLFQEGLKKEDIKKVIPLVQEIIKKVNALSKKEQEKKFKDISNLVKKRKERVGLPDLSIVKGKVVMRLAPFPSGPLHIGNARPIVLNDEYCKMYNGTLYLVIDDTIGSEEKGIVKEAYKLIPEGLKWLGVKYKLPIIYKSDRLEIYYKYAEELIKKDKAYVCFCDAETLHKNREKGIECKHRNASVAENLKHWQEMLVGKYKPHEAILRIKTSMKHKNPAFRDRVLFRIAEREHPKIGKKYRVWPLLEISWAVDDKLLGITHILRGKELMMETDMEKYIFDIFGWKHPEFIHTGLLQFKGTKISKSKSQKEVKSGRYIGWDDPRTWSLQSLEKRGINVTALRTFILQFGITQTEVTVPIEDLYKKNKKFIEKSNRYFFVTDPVKITIKSAPRLRVKVPLHPDHPQRGNRNFTTSQAFFIAQDDYNKLKKGKVYRLMNLLNFVRNGYFEFMSKEYNPKFGAKLIHWLPADEKTKKNLIKTKVLMPDGQFVKGLAESSIRLLKPETIIQFERFGFCRLYKKEKNKLIFWYGHI